MEGLAEWDTFSTWTFAHPVTPEGAMFQARNHLHKLEDLLNGWTPRADARWNAWGYCDDQVEAPRRLARAFVGVQEGRVGGLVHLHALVAGVGDLKTDCGTPVKLKDQLRQEWKEYSPLTCCMKHAWPRGIARVKTYDPELGASFYVSKYITKRLAEWDLVGFPMTAAALQEPLGRREIVVSPDSRRSAYHMGVPPKWRRRKR